MARWLPKRAVLIMHTALMDEHGGLRGTVDEQALDSTLARPRNLQAYADATPTLYELAAAYGYGFARNHCFNDGNKRIALTTMAVFLRMNGLRLAASEEDAVMTIQALASGDISEEALTPWIENHCEALDD